MSFLCRVFAPTGARSRWNTPTANLKKTSDALSDECPEARYFCRWDHGLWQKPMGSGLGPPVSRRCGELRQCSALQVTRHRSGKTHPRGNDPGAALVV